MMKNTKMMTLVAAGVAGLALANMPVHAAEKTITVGINWCVISNVL